MSGQGRHGYGRARGRFGAALAAGLLLAGGSLAGCGGEAPDAGAERTVDPSLGTVTVASDGVQEVTLQTQDDYLFTPDTFTVAPGRVRLTVDNVADEATHNFRFRPGAGPEPIEAEIPHLAPGESRTIEFTVTAPGEHLFECSFHIQFDQVGTMTVSAR
ncbi:MAG TPA: cupredoxin domain-containing protein [Geodermatophilus sp.]|nr:cupredoxin domain-containing protein [Geodermatophilus sp.]